MYSYYNNLLEKNTKYLDSRIKKTDLYKLSRSMYVNQGKIPCECIVNSPDLITFKYHLMKDVGLNVKHEFLYKNVIKMQGNYCLTYSEVRQFNTKHNLVNLNINIEFLLGEKIEINAFKRNYGIILNSLHYKVSNIDNSYELYASIPTVAVSDFHLIPFGEIFLGCYPETVQMFEDFYSSNHYSRKILKK